MPTHNEMRGFVIVIAFLMSIGAGLCSACAHSGRNAQQHAATASDFLFVVPLDLRHDGISGLTEDGDGVLWAVAENRVLLRIDEENSLVQHIPIEGLADDVETEAIVWVSGNRFMVGTEMDTEERSEDPMILVEVIDGRAVAVQHSACDYGMWGILASSNRGVEGLCRVGDQLVVGTELVQELGAKRVAPVAIFDLGTGAWSAFTVELTTDEGKLSALDCKASGDGIAVRAIERHFGISRVLEFNVSPDREATPIRSSVIADFAGGRYSSYNLEGLVWRRDGSMLVVSDNRFKGERQNDSLIFNVANAQHP